MLIVIYCNRLTGDKYQVIKRENKDSSEKAGDPGDTEKPRGHVDLGERHFFEFF